MANQNEKQGFFKKLFGKKSQCCSFQIEEIEDETAEGAMRDQEAAGNKCCCSIPGSSKDKASGDKKGSRQKKSSC